MRQMRPLELRPEAATLRLRRLIASQALHIVLAHDIYQDRDLCSSAMPPCDGRNHASMLDTEMCDRDESGYRPFGGDDMSSTTKKLLWIILAVVLVALVIYGIVALGGGSGGGGGGY
ncbi:hypothetical protein ACFOZ4_35125 [Hamadaea flava]|uniref:Uncharacterized protein n=1 Tax=Hamadaea flava TaxID=1742688 RepID=A0ABV8LZF6_9ACTN